MMLYHVDADYEGGTGPYFGTLVLARKAAREAAAESVRDVPVTLVNVPTDKANVIRMLNAAGGHTIFGEVVYTAKGRGRE